MIRDFISILLPECLYILTFVLFPIVLLVLLWQTRKIHAFKILLFWAGFFLSIGILSFYFFAGHIAFSPFLFTVVNHPLFVFLVLINRYMKFNFDHLYISAFTIIPFLIYPLLGFFIGVFLDKYFHSKDGMAS